MFMRKKVLFFHFDLGVGGAENVLINLLNNLAPSKYDITLLLLFNHGVRLNCLSSHIRLKYVFNFNPFSGISYVLKIFSPRLLHQLFIREKYDYEIAFLEDIPTRIIGGCPYQDTKCFAWVHRSFVDLSTLLHSYRSYNEMEKTYRRFYGTAFVAQSALDSFKALTCLSLENMRVINNVLETEELIERSKAKADIKNKSVVNFCSVGRLTAQKNYTCLVRVLGTLYNEGIRNWHFYLLGRGEQQKLLEKMVMELGLSDNVSMLGFDANPLRYVSKMDFFVCSSLYEGYSTAVTESIILQTPVITTECSGMREIFGNTECGMIVENSEEGLVNGMRRMLTEPELVRKMKCSAKERSHFFSKERCLRQFETFIES